MGMVLDVTKNNNYIDASFENVDICSGATAYYNTTERVNISGFVSVDKNQSKTVNLRVWSSYANSISGQLVALKIK